MNDDRLPIGLLEALDDAELRCLMEDLGEHLSPEPRQATDAVLG